MTWWVKTAKFYLAMGKQNFLRTVLFMVFFSIGAAALCAAILTGELLKHYRSRQLLKTAEHNVARLEAVNKDYDALLRQLEQDPNYAKRIAPAVLGTEPGKDGQTVYPKVTPEQLVAARRALKAESSRQEKEPAIPEWLDRCIEPRRRTVLFLAGAFLILISFVCFGIRNNSGRAAVMRHDQGTKPT